MGKSQLLKFMRRYLLFALAVGMLMLPVYLEAFKLLEENEEKSIDWELSKGMDILDNEILSMNNVILEFQANQYFTYVSYMEKLTKASDYYALKELRDNLADLTGSFAFATDPMVYFPNKIILCRNTVFTSSAQDSYSQFHSEKNGGLESWFGKLSQKANYYEFLPADTFYSASSGTFEGVPYMCSYGIKGQQEQAFFIAILPLNKLYELWGLGELKEISSITVCNSDTGEILHETGAEVAGSSHFFQCDSNKSGLCVKVEVPINYFWDKLSGLGALALIYLLFFVIIAVLGSALMAYKNAKPLRRIVSLLDKYNEPDQTQDNKDFDYIARSITEIGDSRMEYKIRHKRLDEEIAHWMLREQILNGLEGAQLLKLLDIHQDFPMPFRLLIVQLTQTEWEFSSAEVLEELRLSQVSCIFFSRAKPNLFVLTSPEGGGESVWRERLEGFLARIGKNWKCGGVIFISGLIQSLENLNAIYQNGRWSMKCYSDKRLIFQESIERDGGKGLTDLNLMENVRLTDLILDGQEEEARALIGGQWIKVHEAHIYSLLEQLFFMQTAVLNSIAVRLNSEMRMDTLAYSDNIPEMEKRILDFCGELCEIAAGGLWSISQRITANLVYIWALS